MSDFDEKTVIDRITRTKAPVPLSTLIREFRITGRDRRTFRTMLKNLEERGKIVRVRGKSYGAPQSKADRRVLGRLQVTARGFGFVKPDWRESSGDPPFEGDLFVPRQNMGTAMDGDLVQAEHLRSDKEGAMGKVTDVIERAHKQMAGRYQQSNKRGGVVHPRNARIGRQINVAVPDKLLNVEDHDWVDVEITDYTYPPEPLVGRIVSRIGDDDTRGIDVLLVLRDLGIVEEFPKSVEQETEALRFDWKNDLKGRTDYRELPTLTIDPETAKDFDDGLSVERIPEGWRLYVHIADVAHFVVPGTALDAEALERSTSVYPVDRVVPMLPSKLSTFLCSLRPNEDRLAVTAVMDIDESGHIIRSEFHSSAIHSDYRFAYKQIQTIFDGDNSPADACPQLLPVIAELREVARRMRKARMARGALDLDIPEVSVIFDEAGAVSDLKFYPRYEAHQLVEECMLIANEAVAQYLTRKDAELLYRVHEVADQERLEKVAPSLKVFGIQLGRESGSIRPKDIQRALEKAEKLEAGHIVRRLILRALKRAEYDPENAGHFGLASDCYCHFTSPIRRYPDIIVHRQLKALEERTTPPYNTEEYDLDWLGEHTSMRERRAQEAEWEATRIKSLEFMKQFEGEEFAGRIASIQGHGIFVELVDYPVDGFIPFKDLADDHYDLDDTGVRLIGKRTGKHMTLGDKLTVRIDAVEPLAQRLDLSIPEMASRKGRRRKG